MKIRNEGLSWQEIDGELVILDLNSSKYLTTNKTGAFLAKLLSDDDLSLDQLAQALVDEYGIDHGLAISDAGAFVEKLRSKGLLA